MKKLKFDRERAKKVLLERYEFDDPDKKIIDLMLFRTEFLVRNELFIKDVENLRKKKKDSEVYRKQRHELRKKWSIDDYALYDKMVDPDPIVITGRDMDAAPILDQYHVDLRVDFRYPKRKILDAVKGEVDKWHNELRRRMKEGLFYFEEINEIKESPKRLTGNIPSDLQDYDRYLKTWDFKMIENKSWSQIQEEMNISFDTARNWHKRACELIQEGIPGFPPFPSG